MEASGKSLRFLENVGRIKVPFFQRSYVWGEENWQDLLDELYENKKSNFLGSLIFKPMKVKTGDLASVLVIDGQQRLTTLSILIKALYDTFSPQLKKRTQESLNRVLFFKENTTDENYELKIEHSRIDKKYYEMVINPENPEEIFKDTKSQEHKILECYEFFLKTIKAKSEEDNIELFNRLFSQNHKIVVVVDLCLEDDEQTIFDVINNAGVRLSIADTIKNSLFQKLLDLIKNEQKIIKLHDNYWEGVFNKDEEAVKYWETIKVTGRLKRTNIEILLHSIATIENIYNPDEHILEQLPSLYQAKFDKMSFNKLEKFVKDIAEYATLYNKYIIDINRDTNFKFDDYETRLFHILDVYDITTFHPYILHIYKNYGNNKKYLREKLFKLEVFVLRRFITNQETKSYNKICKEFIHDEKAIDKRLAELSDEEFTKALYKISNKAATLLLFWIELKRRNKNNRNDLQQLQYNYTLEHIMPQKWEEHWSNVKVLDDENKVIKTHSDAIAKRNDMIYALGNMTLLKGTLNSSLRNYPFKKKVIGENKRKGMDGLAELLITKEDIIDKFNKTKEGKIWNEKRIRERTEKLTKEVLDIWKV